MMGTGGKDNSALLFGAVVQVIGVGDVKIYDVMIALRRQATRFTGGFVLHLMPDEAGEANYDQENERAEEE